MIPFPNDTPPSAPIMLVHAINARDIESVRQMMETVQRVGGKLPPYIAQAALALLGEAPTAPVGDDPEEEK